MQRNDRLRRNFQLWLFIPNLQILNFFCDVLFPKLHNFIALFVLEISRVFLRSSICLDLFESISGHSSPEYLGHKGILSLSLCHCAPCLLTEEKKIEFKHLSRLSNSRVQLVNPSSVATSRRLFARTITQLTAGWWRVNSEYSSAGYRRSIFVLFAKQ